MDEKRKYGDVVSEIIVPLADVQASYDALHKSLDVVRNNKGCIMQVQRSEDMTLTRFVVEYIENWKPACNSCLV